MKTTTPWLAVGMSGLAAVILNGAWACQTAPRGGVELAPECEPYGLTHQLSADNPHLMTCGEAACGNGLNPPTGGPHCAQTAACRVHSTPQARCEWIHNLEHGHAVLAYHCPSGCPEVVTALQGLWAEAPSPKRLLVTPDPSLKQRVAAVVWGWSWTGDDVDLEAIRCVLSMQDREAPERGLECKQ